MKDNQITTRKFVENFIAGKYEDADRETQIEAGWFDWFCKDESLARRLKPLARFVKAIVDSERVDADNTYVFLKNNCPMVGDLYDSVSIVDIETETVKYWIGFLKKGCHGKDFSRVEISCGDIAENELGSFGNSYVFETAVQAKKFMNGMKYFEVKENTYKKKNIASLKNKKESLAGNIKGYNHELKALKHDVALLESKTVLKNSEIKEIDKQIKELV